MYNELLQHLTSSESVLSPAQKNSLTYLIYFLFICFILACSLKLLDAATNTHTFKSAKLFFDNCMNELWSDKPVFKPTNKYAHAYLNFLSNIFNLILILNLIFMGLAAIFLYCFVGITKYPTLPLWYQLLGFAVLPYCCLHIRKYTNEAINTAQNLWG